MGRRQAGLDRRQARSPSSWVSTVSVMSARGPSLALVRGTESVTSRRRIRIVSQYGVVAVRDGRLPLLYQIR